MHIECKKTKLEALLKFKPKPILYGKWHELKGTIRRSEEDKVLYSIEGFWDKELRVTYVPTNLLFDTWRRNKSRLAVLYHENQDQYCSLKYINLYSLKN